MEEEEEKEGNLLRVEVDDVAAWAAEEVDAVGEEVLLG